METIDIDPFEIESWQQYCTDCIETGQSWRFRKALSDYLFWTNRPAKAELNAYFDRRRGEIDRERLDEQIKLKKPRLPTVKRKFV